jgi:glycosylphosphatidylinositol transamidase (GPIT) subunit GPI8
MLIGVSLIDRFTFSLSTFFESHFPITQPLLKITKNIKKKTNKLKSKTVQNLIDSMDIRFLHSTPTIWSSPGTRSAATIPLMDFFGNKYSNNKDVSIQYEVANSINSKDSTISSFVYNNNNNNNNNNNIFLKSPSIRLNINDEINTVNNINNSMLNSIFIKLFEIDILFLLIILCILIKKLIK